MVAPHARAIARPPAGNGAEVDRLRDPVRSARCAGRGRRCILCRGDRTLGPRRAAGHAGGRRRRRGPARGPAGRRAGECGGRTRPCRCRNRPGRSTAPAVPASRRRRVPLVGAAASDGRSFRVRQMRHRCPVCAAISTHRRPATRHGGAITRFCCISIRRQRIDQVSYVDVLNDPSLAARLGESRGVLVGVTAAGIGGGFRTSLAQRGGLMPAVEFHARAFEALKAGDVITPLDRPTIVLLTLIAIGSRSSDPPSLPAQTAGGRTAGHRLSASARCRAVGRSVATGIRRSAPRSPWRRLSAMGGRTLSPHLVRPVPCPASGGGHAERGGRRRGVGRPRQPHRFRQSGRPTLLGRSAATLQRAKRSPACSPTSAVSTTPCSTPSRAVSTNGARFMSANRSG